MTSVPQAPRVRQSCSGLGTNNLSLQAPLSSYMGFGDAFPTNTVVTYCIRDGNGSAWEVGRGTLISSTELSRDYVYASSASSGYQNSSNPASRAKISLTANTHEVFNTMPVELQIFLNAEGQLEDPTPFRATIILPTIAAMVAELVPATNEGVICLGYASVSDGKGGMFRWDGADATAPDGIDSFRNANSSTGLYKRVRLDPAPLLVFSTTTALRGDDAAALYKSGRRAIVLGRAAEGDRRPFHLQWDSASTATHDGAMVFRPTTGAASTGAGRWLRTSNTPAQAFTSADATPSIAGGDYFTTAGTTAITDFDDAYEGQIFVVERGASDIAINHNASLVDLGGSNLTLTTSRPRAIFQHIGGVHKLLAAPMAYGAGWQTALGMAASNTYTVNDVADLRSKTWVSAGAPASVNLKKCFDAADGGGTFHLDAADTSTSDDAGFCVVTASGLRYKRVRNGSAFSAAWFGSLKTAFSATLAAAIAACGTGATIEVPEEKYSMTAGVTLLALQTLVFKGRDVTEDFSTAHHARVSRAFNGVGFDMTAAGCFIRGLNWDGVGATYTGACIRIAGGQQQRLDCCDIDDNADACVIFEGADAGQRMLTTNSHFRRTNPMLPAILLPTDAETAGNRQFLNCSSFGGVLLQFNKSVNTHVIDGRFVNLDFSGSAGVSLRAIVANCRIAALAGALAVYGADSAISNNVIAGSITLSADSARNSVSGNTLLAGATITDNSASTGDNVNAIYDGWYDVTPNWKADTTDPVIGNGTLVGRVYRSGRKLRVSVDVVMGSTTTYGVGAWYFTLPAPFNNWVAKSISVGPARLFDNGTAYDEANVVMAAGSSRMYAFPEGNGLSSTNPFSWAQNDTLSFSIEYEIS